MGKNECLGLSYGQLTERLALVIVYFRVPNTEHWTAHNYEEAWPGFLSPISASAGHARLTMLLELRSCRAQLMTLLTVSASTLQMDI